MLDDFFPTLADLSPTVAKFSFLGYRIYLAGQRNS